MLRKLPRYRKIFKTKNSLLTKHSMILAKAQFQEPYQNSPVMDCKTRMTPCLLVPDHVVNYLSNRAADMTIASINKVTGLIR